MQTGTTIRDRVAGLIHGHCVIDSSQFLPLLEIVTQSDYINGLPENNFPETLTSLNMPGITNVITHNPEFVKYPEAISKKIWQNSKNMMAVNTSLGRCSALVLSHLFAADADLPALLKTVKSNVILTDYDGRCIISAWVLTLALRAILADELGPNARKHIYNMCMLAMPGCANHVTSPADLNNLRAELYGKFITKCDTSKPADRHTFTTLSYIIWTFDIICKFNSMSPLGKMTLSYDKIMAKVTGDAVTRAVVSCMLGTYLGTEQLPKPEPDILEKISIVHAGMDTTFANIQMPVQTPN